ncbi:MAG: electron transfer flavoprotein subunit alpha/FixB family protein [Chloroflexi bacterium]|nr:electron transfer flavoprotein subunit alpha/FixB family protein [Chloroflexota bacterium]
MAENRGVLVFGEVKDGALTGLAREGVALGLQLAGEAGGQVTAIVIGPNAEAQAKELIASGAQKVYTFESADLADYQPDAYLQVLLKAVATANPKVIIFGQTDTGKDLAPKLAFRLKSSLSMDCVDVTLEGGKLVATKPVYGGNAQGIYESDADLHAVTLRAKAVEALEPDGSRKGEIVALDASIDESAVKVRVVEVKRQEAEGIRLEDASVVVSGGRGFGGPEPFEQLEELAKVLGGAVGASRAVCDAGWLDHSYQVGLTGKTVTPDLYIAVAISGASQHMAGCSGSKNIVSINKDKDSNIFKESRFGVVGSWEEVLPAFIEMVKELRGS